LNRWGNPVFETTSSKPFWDGKIHDKSATEGVYFWVADYTDYSGKGAVLHGTVSLFR
jgi:hypothetical protein